MIHFLLSFFVNIPSDSTAIQSDVNSFINIIHLIPMLLGFGFMIIGFFKSLWEIRD